MREKSENLREHFFGKTPETLALVQDMTDDDIWRLTRGGHDLDKIHAAYYEAVHNNSGKPVVILAKTIKGFGMVGEGESQNIAHQQKKLSTITLQKIRDQFQIPLSNEQIEDLPFLELEANTPEYNYLHERRKELGGYYPKRTITKDSVIVPNLAAFNTVLYGLQTREISTTMAFVRILNILLKDNNLKSRIVPIVPDESRTFGMEGMFRQLGIWSHVGQLYTPEDASQLMFYKEDVKGQIFQEGINEPGAISTWIAAATSYSNHDITMIPFYIYYSMFGFQRVGDLAWAAGDMRARGFLIGATSGRTTLNGEGLQHEDGHSHIQAGLIPNCETYDPTFAHELAVIVQHGLEEMYVLNQDKFYYITVMNENYSHYDYNENYKDGIIRGCYLLKQQIVDDKKLQNSIEQYRLKTSAKSTTKLIVNLLGSGSILREAIFAAEILSAEYGIDVNLFSATSFNKLYKDGISVDRHNILTPSLEWQAPYISQLFYDTFEATYTTNAQSYLEDSVTVAATDYIRSYANQVRAYIPTQYYVLGTDGFGRSDFRVELRKYFEVNRYYIILTALYGLVQKGFIDKQILLDTMKKYDIDSSKQNPWEV